MGRLASALADALSPFTEGLGLVGDSIRFHRERRVIENASLAKRLLSEQNIEISGTPLKFITQWAENTSVEDDNSELNGMWAHLLANAGGAYEQRYLSYIDILKSMSGEEARFLNQICKNGEIEVSYEIERNWLEHIVGDVKNILEDLRVDFLKSPFSSGEESGEPSGKEKIFDHNWNNARLVSQFSYPNVTRNSGVISTKSGQRYYYRPGLTEDIFCHKSLVRKGLLYEATIDVTIDIFGEKSKVNVWFLQATEIGIDLVRTCSKITGATLHRGDAIKT